ncbi:MAG TPA: DUF3667 domain-containing protein [Ideonella sp.]|nr:DUF3667 domain-containing protein [Ideonella sp.]
MQAAPPIDPPGQCPNCGVSLGPPPPKFCPDCGQETRVRAPTLQEFVQQFGGAYFSTEGALWRTLKTLLLQPGELTRQYLAGRRKHFVLPLRLYLTISLVTLLLLRTLGSGVNVEFGPNMPGRQLHNGKPSMALLFGRVGLKEGAFFCHDLPEWVCTRMQRRLDHEPAVLADQLAQVKERFIDHIGAAMFVLLPSFAFWMWLAYFNRRLRYTEHLVFALHVHAFWFIGLALSLPDQIWLSAPAFIAVPWYTFAAMRRVYGGRRWPRLLRGTLVALLYGVTLVAVTTGLAVWSLLS